LIAAATCWWVEKVRTCGVRRDNEGGGGWTRKVEGRRRWSMRLTPSDVSSTLRCCSEVMITDIV
jgi:hypothetical protein